MKVFSKWKPNASSSYGLSPGLSFPWRSSAVRFTRTNAYTDDGTRLVRSINWYPLLGLLVG